MERDGGSIFHAETAAYGKAFKGILARGDKARRVLIITLASGDVHLLGAGTLELCALKSQSRVGTDLTASPYSPPILADSLLVAWNLKSAPLSTLLS